MFFFYVAEVFSDLRKRQTNLQSSLIILQNKKQSIRFENSNFLEKKAESSAQCPRFVFLQKVAAFTSLDVYYLIQTPRVVRRARSTSHAQAEKRLCERAIIKGCDISL